MTFPVSGVDVSLWVPAAAGLVAAFFASMGGVSGAFLLLPFQISVLGFASPAVSPTTLVYNLVAIPSGVYRYIREGRMAWPLTWVIVAGTLPGVIVGVVVRIKYLPDPGAFKLFVGCVLCYIGGRLLYDIVKRAKRGDPAGERSAAGHDPSSDCTRQANDSCDEDNQAVGFRVRTNTWSWRRIAYDFQGETYSISTLGLFPFVLTTGVVGGAYGVGGGSIVGPFLVSVFGLPVHTVAGAVLMSTFATSIVGVVFYRLAAVHYASMGVAIAPDWLLGGLFGVGGAVGMYLGARCQRHVPERPIKLALAAMVFFLAFRYMLGFFR